MKILIANSAENPASALRRCGYHFERQHPETGEISAARSFGAGGFPRFHAYAKTKGGQTPLCLEINLHLDQKRPVYRGASAHGGEYDGEVVEQEAERIKSILLPSP